MLANLYLHNKYLKINADESYVLYVR